MRLPNTKPLGKEHEAKLVGDVDGSIRYSLEQLRDGFGLPPVQEGGPKTRPLSAAAMPSGPASPKTTSRALCGASDGYDGWVEDHPNGRSIAEEALSYVNAPNREATKAYAGWAEANEAAPIRYIGPKLEGIGVELGKGSKGKFAKNVRLTKDGNRFAGLGEEILSKRRG
ncbi:MAG: hypothetical protein ABJX32_06110 [Tateyamaria sp.]|uniref:hypothetical protein n=1 Tax=Tateyamaria sp. TaxID=1929288 RepID=UPI0032A0E720